MRIWVMNIIYPRGRYRTSYTRVSCVYWQKLNEPQSITKLTNDKNVTRSVTYVEVGSRYRPRRCRRREDNRRKKLEKPDLSAERARGEKETASSFKCRRFCLILYLYASLRIRIISEKTVLLLIFRYAVLQFDNKASTQNSCYSIEDVVYIYMYICTEVAQDSRGERLNRELVRLVCSIVVRLPPTPNVTYIYRFWPFRS